jgi:hypothetical protein
VYLEFDSEFDDILTYRTRTRTNTMPLDTKASAMGDDEEYGRLKMVGKSWRHTRMTSDERSRAVNGNTVEVVER